LAACRPTLDITGELTLSTLTCLTPPTAIGDGANRFHEQLMTPMFVQENPEVVKFLYPERASRTLMWGIRK